LIPLFSSNAENACPPALSPGDDGMVVGMVM